MKKKKRIKIIRPVERYWGKDPERWRYGRRNIRTNRRIFIECWYIGRRMRVELRRKYRMFPGKIMEIKTVELKSSKKWKFVALRGFKEDGTPYFVNRDG